MSAEKLKSTLAGLQEHDGIIFSMRGVPNIDLTAIGVLDDFQAQAAKRNQLVIYTSLQPDVKKQLAHLWQDDQRK